MVSGFLHHGSEGMLTKQFAGGKMPKSMRRLMGKKGGKGMLGGKMPGLPF